MLCRKCNASDDFATYQINGITGLRKICWRCRKDQQNDARRRARQRRGLKTGFWPKVIKTETCWLWQSAVKKGIYGLTTYKGTRMGAHQISWVIHNGPIPTGQFVLHRCDNPPCVRPDHLFLGTATDNMRDMYVKGRGPTGDRNGSRTQPHRRPIGDRNGSRKHPEKMLRGDDHWTRKFPGRLKGELNPRSKLSNKQIEEIRNKFEAREFTKKQLSVEYNVTQAHISRIVRYKCR